jgi:nucleoid-associated protein YgaU
MVLTIERPFATVWLEQMYATGYDTHPLRSGRRVVRLGRLVVVLLLALAVSLGLAVVAHGGTAPVYSTVVVQPGDTLWSIAAERYPSDDVRARVQDIESANGLGGPIIRVGETLRLPA